MKTLVLVGALALPLFFIADASAKSAKKSHVIVHGRAAQQKVPAATVVEFQPFSVTVPMHWSFQGVVESKPVGPGQMTIDFITAPGNLKTSKVYVGVREQASRYTMDEIRKQLGSKKGHRTKTAVWNGQNWILDEFQGLHPHSTVWTAYIVHSGKQYLMVAESPNKQRPHFEPLILSVMKSFRFSSAPAPTRGQ